QVITTNAGVTYTSLPGANGSVPFYGTVATTLGASGDPYGERNGQDGVPTNSPPTTPLNNYADTDPATLNVPNGNVVKTVQTTDLSSTSGTDVAVGETVTYRLTVTLPEGTTTGLVVTDNLPAGMQYVAGSANVITTGFNGNTGAAPTVTGGTGDGDDITFSFGTITVDGDNNTSNNSFIIEFQAIVLKVSGNEGILPVQTTLNNAATLQVGTGPIVTTPDVPVTVVEPQLQVVKSVVNADTSIDAGTTVQYQVVISHTNKSTGPAFDLSINDLLASIGMDLVVGSVGITNPGYGIQSVTSGNTAGDTNVAVTVSELRLGDTITVTYSAVLQGAADSGPAPGSTVTNTVKVDYDTFPGETPQERQEPQIQGTADITVNTYSVSGNIYRDLNNNGVYEPGSGETLITGSVDLLLTGKDHQGNDVSIPLNTINGTYIFSGLRPSDASGYTITQVTQPTGLLDGRDTPGTPFTGTGTAATDDRGTPQVPARDADAISAIVIPLNAAQDGTANAGVNYNFGELPAASLGDFVFVDTNGNGVQDVGEPGLNGVTVQLTGTDDTGHPVNLTTTTANMSGVDGKYLFTGLRPSDANGYTVTFTAPSGYFFTVPNSTLLWATDANDSDATPQGGTTGTTGGYVIVAGQNETSVDAGLYQPVTIGDTVFYDTNGNGIQDGTMNLPEPGIPSVQVTLLYAGPDGDFATTGDNASFTTLTDANGSYSFANRIPGVYKVQVDTVTVSASGTVPDGLTATTATTQLTTPMLLTSGSTDQDRDFGFRGSGAVGDRVFLDVNGNGVYDAGEGLDGVTVTISGDLDGNGTIESDEVLTTTTGPDGYYQFANLRTSPVGVTYTVTVNPADLPEDGLGNILTNTIDPDTANPGDNTSQVTLTNAAPSNQDQDFGYQGPGLIGDTIFLDVNNNGMPDPGEGITGVPVTLTGDVDGDGTLETFVTTTDANGVYDFSHLPVANKNGTPITYTVTVDTSDLPTGVTNTVDPDTPSPGNSTSQVTLSGAAPVDLDQDFGYRGTGSIGDRVFLDLNGDGVWNAGEGIANVHVTLTADVNGDGVSETFTAITDVDGYYDFTGLPVYQKDGTTPVSYTVAVNTGDLPVGVTNTADPDGGTANQSVLTLVGNPNNNLQDFGYQGTGSLGDRVWLDSDGNGLQGSLLLEPGLPSVDLTLTFAGQDGVLGTADD
ncbi:MAG: isopeptide-forming domain-containing fimbrial protein, partial [Bacteroidales bacterium]|nr:isopeptide-forming domain-containing fimbrial protein [Bacteroidales bacterium]